MSTSPPPAPSIIEEVSTGDGEPRRSSPQSADADGDAWIKVEHGSVLDVNSNATHDERTEQELANGLWSDLSLTNETGAQQKIQDTIDSLQNLRTREYQTYWQFRTALANGLTLEPRHDRHRDHRFHPASQSRRAR